ncbi:single-stranded DNA-binding protein 3 isoform X3 [Lingula anatina]|uniref:Single-stranded DNA-binding protein 3 isoform X3 n=1 Tax=Lingula anatina TaxID=7574 RepID=A0A1S3ISF7_LINAN|nr:single-stranded DNA-binding protein 3 isoform X3 [Lingula anatina]|eukprot:XP_013400469.1 single-stranded DNA-binding protein 3 isoform X3 [Lingula anatina]
MYAKGKGSTVPSDAQAREKLALYVYEYLLHVGAQKSAQTFLSEIRWEKNITLGEPPGFLHSWWCVFWDLYCAAPERRDTCDHSSEAKAFHDYDSTKSLPLNQSQIQSPENHTGFVNSGYVANGLTHNTAPSPLGQMPPQDGMPGGPMPPGFFPNAHMRPSPPASQPSPHPQPPHNPMMGQGQPFMSPRYPGGPRGPVRMPNDFPPGTMGGCQMPMPNSMDVRPGPPMAHMQRMPGRMPGPMNPNYGPMRGPAPNGMVPGGPGPGGPGPGMPPMSIPGQMTRPWPPSSQPMSYSSPSPGNYSGPPTGGPPGTPIMPSPQGSTGPYSPASHRMNSTAARRDSSSGEMGYMGMKPNMGMPFPGMGPDNPMGPMGPDMNPVMNGGDGLDGMKSSPANGGPGTPRHDEMPPVSAGDMGGYNLPYQDNVGNKKRKDKPPPLPSLNNLEWNLGLEY